jgi:hypothetical protein
MSSITTPEVNGGGGQAGHEPPQSIPVSSPS